MLTSSRTDDLLKLRNTVFCAIAVLMVLAAQAVAFDTPARSAIVYDVRTGQTLMEKNADMPLPPASMSKLMTLNMVFEALVDGRITLDQLLPVSRQAEAYTGSTMFLTTRDRVSVEDLIRGVIVMSGNDASAVLAEALSPDGTEAGFAAMMTERARDLGMTQSVFANSNGWPAPSHRMSTRDLSILANRLITEFPQYYGYFAEREFSFDGRAPDNRFNRNPLLALGIGADGLKTGHTQEAGYGLVGSAKQGDRRIVFVLSGLDTQNQRAEESERIVNWAFRQFVERKVASEGREIARADVWMGAQPDVGLAPSKDIEILISALKKDDVEARVEYRGPVNAPILAGDVLAKLIIVSPGFEDETHDLVATQSVESGGILMRLRTAATILWKQVGGQAATLF